MFGKLNHLYSKIPSFLRNKYSVTLIAFIIWMSFFDRNYIVSQVKLRMELQTICNKKKYYQEKTEEVKADRKDLLTNLESLEKFAREKYWMKRDNEDIFIIVKEKK